MKTLKVAAGLSCLALLTACEDKQAVEVNNTPWVKAIEISVIDFSDKLCPIRTIGQF